MFHSFANLSGGYRTDWRKALVTKSQKPQTKCLQGSLILTRPSADVI